MRAPLKRILKDISDTHKNERQNNMKPKSFFLSCVTVLIAAATAATASASSTGLVTGTVSQKMFASASGVNVPYRSQADIRNYVSANQFSTSEAISFSSQPDMTSPYNSSGALSSATLNNGLNAMNVMRYIAGLPEVTFNSDYNALCQDGAYVSAINGTISHYPNKPNGISDSIYESGKTACGSSNLAMGYTNPAAAVLGYMDDSDSSNIDRLGHRRWILNPSMEQTGMGQVNRCSALYAFDNSFGKTSLSGVCWPAQTMPAEYFDGAQAWSWTSGEIIDDPTAVNVTLKRNFDGKTWNFSYNSADGYFNVENSVYGKPGCVIFRPDNLTVNAGDSFTVNITGTGKTVNYTVDFFSLNSSEGSGSTTAPAAPSAVTGLKALNSTSSSITLSWNKTSTADSYEIDMYKNGKWVCVAKITDGSYTVSGLSANTSYNFKVFSFKNGQYSNSAALTAKTAAAPQSSSSVASSSSSTASSSNSTASSSNSAASNSSSTASSSSSAASSSSSVASSSSSVASSSSSVASSSSNTASSSSSTVSSSNNTQIATGTSNDESSQAAAENNSGSSFPIVPIAIGGGAAVAGGIGTLVAHIVKKRKNG